MADTHYDVIVIGAGPGGTTAASLLANKGKKVLLVDKNPSPGGRMLTVQKNGFKYEMFPINCVPSFNSLYEKLSKTLGKENDVNLIIGKEFGDIGVICYEDENGVVRSWNMGDSIPKMLKMLGVKLYDIKSLLQTIKVLAKLAQMKPDDIEKLYDISAMDFMNSLKPMPKSVYTYILSSFGEGVYEMSSDKVPAAEMIKIFQEAAKNNGGRYYEGGIGHFFEVMASAVEENGGKMLMNTRVASIDIAGGKVSGITTESGEKYFAPTVVSSAGIRQSVLKLAGEEHFEPSYVKRIKELQSNLACVGYRYFVDAPVLDHVMMVYYPEGCVETYEEFERMTRGEKKPKHNYIYIGTTSFYPNMAPKDQQIIYSCMSCAPDPAIDVQPYLDYVEARTKKIVPDLYNHIISKEIMSPADVPAFGNDSIFDGQGGESYGVAIAVGQAGKTRPEFKSPVDGLFFVGNDVAGEGLGTHLAVDSGFKVFEFLVKAGI